MVTRNIILALFLVAGSTLTGAALAQSGQGWQHVRTVGMINMVLVDRARDKDKDVYREAIGSICGPKTRKGGPPLCKVLFWADASMVPGSMPMTAAQAGALRANWTWNLTTGYRSLLWSCDIEPDPAQCFEP